MRPEVPIERIAVSVYRVPTDGLEADGTLAWDSTTLVFVEVHAGGERGQGYTYGNEAAGVLIERKLAAAVTGCDALAIPAAWQAMVRVIRNSGRPGLCSMAISAVDAALWDLKARLLGLPLVALLGAMRGSAPVYASGGFTSYPAERLHAQLRGWADDGIRAVKIKVGSDPDADPARVRTARDAIGEDVALFVDANGVYSRKQALAMAEIFAGFRVVWFEEPVSSDDLDGLRLIRDRAPAGMDVAAGEYGYDTCYFRRMLEAGAVDVLQVDGSRCGGITGVLRAAALAEAFQLPVSAHTAPSLHAHVVCALTNIRPLEYFHDHARIEAMLFDGCLHPVDGVLTPDLSRPGFGFELRARDASRYAI